MGADNGGVVICDLSEAGVEGGADPVAPSEIAPTPAYPVESYSTKVLQGSGENEPPAVAALSTDGVVSLWIELSRLESQIAAVIHSAPASGLSDRQMAALSCLPHEGLTMRAFATALGISGPAATAAADRLIKAGMAERARDPLDRRVVRLVATSAGLSVITQFRSARLHSLAGLVGQLSAGRLTYLAGALGGLASRPHPSPRESPPTDPADPYASSPAMATELY
ncbi:MAG TPA: MarR family transcriptional regulator [Candidatus Dormibacteraeota bacterium]|nr:MarR family transcriptional regulator [Candidatus Dormibacteraeota bacterium]